MFRVAGPAHFRISKTDPFPWRTGRVQENDERAHPRAIPVCRPGDVS